MTISIDETKSTKSSRKVTITEALGCSKSKPPKAKNLHEPDKSNVKQQQESPQQQQIELKRMLEVPKTTCSNTNCAINILKCESSTPELKQFQYIYEPSSTKPSSKSNPSSNRLTTNKNHQPPRTIDEANENGDDNAEPKRSRRLRLLDFFCSKRIKPNSIKMPQINIQRGPIIAIVISLLVSVLILWYVISGDDGGVETEEDEFKNKFTSQSNPKKGGNLYLNPQFNRTRQEAANAANNSTGGGGGGSDYKYIEDPFKLAFVLITTLLIVIAIVVFVFVGSLVHYYKKPSPFMKTRSQSIVSSIFSHHNHHNYLYYLGKDDDDEDEKATKEKSKKEKTNSVKSKSSAGESRTPNNSVSPPIIVVNHSN